MADYAQNFDSVTPPAVPAGWLVTTGGGGLATSASSGYASSPNVLGVSSGFAYYGGISSANLDVTAAVSVAGSGYTGDLAVCLNAAGTTYYSIEVASSSYNFYNVNKTVGGTPTTLPGGTSVTRPAYVAPAHGPYMMARIQAVGGVIRTKMWNVGATEPTAWDFTYTDPSPLAAGYAGYSNALDDWSESVVSAVTFTAAPGSVIVGSAGNVISLVGTGTAWDSGTVFSVAGATKTAQTVTDATHATVTITAGGTVGSGNVTISDSADAATATLSTVPVPAPSFTVSPNSVATGSTQTVTLTGAQTAWTSGTTFSLSGGAGASLTGVSVNVGAQTATGTLAAGSAVGTLTLHDSTDSAAATVAVTAPALKIGFVGDSITYGQGASTLAANAASRACAYLGVMQNAPVTQVNAGASGTTSTDWLPTGTLLGGAKAGFAAQGVTVVNVALGTNDAKVGAQANLAAYQANLSAIAGNLVAAGYTVVLQPPPFVVAGSASGQWDASSDALLASYAQAVLALANGTTIFAGNTSIYGYFAAHPSELTDGIHPTDTGHDDLGKLWSGAVYAALHPSGAGGGGGTTQVGALHIFGSDFIVAR